jgi:hypothetical protein
MVVPPRSGKTSVPTFCVEHDRWVVGEKGKKFGFTVNPALAPKGVRGAAKFESSQEGVWTCVRVQKGSAASRLKVQNTNSSVNETLDAPQVCAISEEYAQALGSALDSPEGRDAVGVAIVVNGQIEEVNVYPNRALFVRLYPRLIQSYAFQATLLKDQFDVAGPLTVADAARFLTPADSGSERQKNVDTHNTVRVQELDDNKFLCSTRYDGQLVHWQVMKKNGKNRASRLTCLGNDW